MEVELDDHANIINTQCDCPDDIDKDFLGPNIHDIFSEEFLQSVSSAQKKTLEIEVINKVKNNIPRLHNYWARLILYD